MDERELAELASSAKKACDMLAMKDPGVLTALIQAQALHRLADALAPLERIAGAMEAMAGAEEPPIEIRWEEARQFAEEQLEELTRGTAPDPLPIRIGKGWVHGYTPASTGLRGLEEVKVYDSSISEGWKWTQACEVGDQDLWAPAHVDSSPLFRELSLRRRPATTPTEPTTPTSAPQEPQEPPSPTPGGHPLDQEGWIRSRVPTEGDGDVVGDVKVAIRDDSWVWCHWSCITPGQPWAPASADPSLYTPQPLPAHIAYPESDGWVHDRVPGPEDGDRDGDVGIPTGCRPRWLHWSHVVPGQPWLPLRTTTPSPPHRW